MGEGEIGERTIATGEGRLSDSEGRVAAVEMERESLGLTAREASIFVE